MFSKLTLKSNSKLNIKFKIAIFILIFAFCIPIFSLASDSIYVWSQSVEALPSNASLGVNAPNANLNIESGSAILIEQHSGKVLFEYNSHEKLLPASVTKVMSILLIMEAIDSGRLSYTDKIPCTENAAGMGGSQIWLDVREELTVDEMLKAICIASANDCTLALAEYLAGSAQAFVDQMNAKAKELNMNDTTFKNCHGLDEDGHVTSSYDIALMSKELLNKHPSITKYTTVWMDTLRDGKSELVNTNKLIRNYKGITGLKTGSTSLAKYNLSASATRDDLSLIAVIMKAPNTKVRFSEAQKLLDYGFSNYTYTPFSVSENVIKDVTVNKGLKPSVSVAFENDSGALIKKGQERDVVQSMQLPNIIEAPVYKGQKIGEAIFSLDNEVISTVPIIATEDVGKDTFLNITNTVLCKWFSLFRT